MHIIQGCLLIALFLMILLKKLIIRVNYEQQFVWLVLGKSKSKVLEINFGYTIGHVFVILLLYLLDIVHNLQENLENY